MSWERASRPASGRSEMKGFMLRVSTALMLSMSAGQFAPAYAQDQADDTEENAKAGDTITVTGSRIGRKDATSVGPLTTLTGEDIAASAPTSAGDLLQAMPSVGVSLNSNGTQGTSFGVSSINLRYLGSAEGSGNRTLVLVDGKRWVNAVGGRGFRDFVDLNTIPLGIIDRIEVLKDGASAIYGADAIAGVVNIQTKRKIDGFEGNVRLGVSSRGDSQNYSGFLNYGRDLGQGSLLVSASYNDSRPILTSDRKISARALTPLTAPPTSQQGLYVLPGLTSNAFFGTPANFGNSAANALTRDVGITSIGAGNTADNAFRVARLPGDDYNTMTQGLYATGPSKRLGLFARGEVELSDSISLRVEGLYNYRRSSQLFAPFPLDVRGSNGFRISADQAFNPFGTANGVPLANALAFSGSTFRIQRVPIEVGNRDNQQTVKTVRLAAGLEGSLELAGDWKWDAFFSWSRNRADFNAINQINLENVYLGLHSPALCSASQGCVPLNIFGTITPEMANYIRYNAKDENGASQYDFTVNLSRSLFDLPAGPVGFAMGYEYRKEAAYDRPDAFAATPSLILPLVSGARQNPTTAQSRDPTVGSYDLHEGYAEISVPLLADAPGFYSLDVDAATRYSHYSTVGGKLTSKFGLAWRPIEDILVRGTFSQGFRAPSILELYQGVRQTNFQGTDPCNGGGAGFVGCAGVPTSYNQSQFNAGLIAGLVAGNQNLKPETATTWSAGLALTPGNFTFTVDWFKIDVEDAIAAQTATQILTTCANSGNFCDLVSRASSGEITELRQAVVNLSQIKVSGIDATARYRAPLGTGTIEASVDASYLDSFRTFIPQPNGTIIVDERAGKSDQPRSTFPRWKGQASLRYSAENWTLGWKTRYIGSSDDIPGNAVNGGKLSDVFYHDAQIAFDVNDGAYNFAFGVDNIFDRQPPASAANNPINFDIYTYDIRGRYMYVRIGTKF